MSEVGGLLRPGNLNGSCVRDPGSCRWVFIVISGPGRGGALLVPFGLGV